MAGLGVTELLVILAIVVLLFGGSKLPKLGQSLGESIANFKKGVREAERASDDTKKIDKDNG
ncbi:MAG: twin-arginine translocase TatA/TatE family subunit [Pseudomonadota bacterium]